MNLGELREIGATGVRIGPLGFGGAAIANLFSSVAETQAAEAIRTAFTIGLCHFDTAPYYGYGLSESRLGPLLAEMPRQAITVATKAGYVLGCDLARESDSVFSGDLPDIGVAFDYSRAGLLASLEGSLGRLGLDRIDILLIHDLDSTVHRDADVLERHHRMVIDEGWPTLSELRATGVVRAIGFGLNHAGMAHRLLKETDPDVMLLAGRYTLLEQTDALPFLDACTMRGVAAMIGGPFNSGILAGGSHYDYAAADAGVRARVARLAAVCAAHEVALSAAALHFPFGQPAVMTVLPGMRSAEEVRRNAALLASPVPAELWRQMRAEGLLAEGVPTPRGGLGRIARP